MNKIALKNYPMVNPTPVVIIGVVVNGKANYTTIGAFGVVCMEPVFYISLKSTHYSTVGIKESGYFSINLPSAEMVQETDYAGMVSGKSVDKSTLFTTVFEEQEEVPFIEEAPMNYICKVIQTTSIHGFEVFFGEIISTYAKGECLTEGIIDPLKVNPLLLMGMQYYNLKQPVGGVFKEGITLKRRYEVADITVNPHL